MELLELEQSSGQSRNRKSRSGKAAFENLSCRVLRLQNSQFAGTSGLSQNNRRLGLVPGYLDIYSGETSVSRFADGRPAPIHVLDGLPQSWVIKRDRSGRVLEARNGVIAGFIGHGRFYTREQAAALAER